MYGPGPATVPRVVQSADHRASMLGIDIGLGIGIAARAVIAVLVRPRLWATAVRQWARMVAPGWWRRPPFLPVPDPDYLRFRWQTQYGSTAPADAHDFVIYLEWCRTFGR